MQLIEKVIPFFERYRLLSKKRDFELFADIVRRLDRKEHWNREGFERIVKLAFQMNSMGKQRKNKLDEILEASRIPRGHTPSAPEKAEKAEKG